MMDFKLGTCDRSVIDGIQRKTIREQRKRFKGDVRLFSFFYPGMFHTGNFEFANTSEQF